LIKNTEAKDIALKWGISLGEEVSQEYWQYHISWTYLHRQSKVPCWGHRVDSLLLAGMEDQVDKEALTVFYGRGRPSRGKK
jgi:hypothetical protein